MEQMYDDRQPVGRAVLGLTLATLALAGCLPELASAAPTVTCPRPYPGAISVHGVTATGVSCTTARKIARVWQGDVIRDASVGSNGEQRTHRRYILAFTCTGRHRTGPNNAIVLVVCTASSSRAVRFSSFF